MTIEQVTLDTGALTAIERRKRRGLLLLDASDLGRAILHVPVPVVAEWWRGRTDHRERILEVVNVAPLTLAVARSAGEALASMKKPPSVLDAIVMAFAARHGGIVYTSDVGDLEALRDAHFPSVRVLAV